MRISDWSSDVCSSDLVAHAEVDYKAPILLDEEIDICVRCSRVGRSSMTFLFELHGKSRDDLRATGIEVSVHVAEAQGAPAPVPDELLAMFETFEGRALRGRSEEHTSELQSLMRTSYAVFCLNKKN